MDLQKLNQIPSKKTHKILWTVIGVLFLIVVAGSIAWWQMVKQTSSTNKFVPHYDAKQNCYMVYEDLCAQSDSTASWQTYTNRQYAFEFKYPKSENITENVKISSLGRIQTSDPLQSQTYDEPIGTLIGSIELAVTNTPDLKKRAEDVFRGHASNSDSCSNQKIENSGLNIVRLSCRGEGEPFQIALIKKDNFDVFFEGGPKDLFDQILSTFKFTDSTADTSTWKTFTNSQYGVAISYPSNWIEESFEPPYTQFNTLKIMSAGKDPKDIINGSDIDLSFANISEGFFEYLDPTIIDVLQESKTIKINNIDAQKIEFAYFDYYIITNKDNVAVALRVKKQDSATNKQIVSDIVNSFKFTK